MAPRAYWKGILRLSLVTCPVELFPASSLAERTHFHMINRKTGNRLHQQMVDEKTGETVEKDDKGRGYEIGKDRYVEIDDEELQAVQLESTHVIDIDAFVPRSEIDIRYLDKPYYIAPASKIGTEAFAVIRDAMKNKDRVGLAHVVLSHREHVVALEPLGKGMLATTLRYGSEVRDEDAFFSDIPAPKIDRDMVELAEHILDGKAAHFDASQFKDRYEAALKALVRRKAAGKEIAVPTKAEKPDNVINLMDALRRSLESSGQPRRGPASRGPRDRHSRPKKKLRPGASTKRRRRRAA